MSDKRRVVVRDVSGGPVDMSKMPKSDKLKEAIRWWDRMNDLELQPVDWRPAIPVAFAAARWVLSLESE